MTYEPQDANLQPKEKDVRLKAYSMVKSIYAALAGLTLTSQGSVMSMDVTFHNDDDINWQSIGEIIQTHVSKALFQLAESVLQMRNTYAETQNYYEAHRINEVVRAENIRAAQALMQLGGFVKSLLIEWNEVVDDISFLFHTPGFFGETRLVVMDTIMDQMKDIGQGLGISMKRIAVVCDPVHSGRFNGGWIDLDRFMAAEIELEILTNAVGDFRRRNNL